jgi:hypothetical protein
MAPWSEPLRDTFQCRSAQPGCCATLATVLRRALHDAGSCSSRWCQSAVPGSKPAPSFELGAAVMHGDPPTWLPGRHALAPAALHFVKPDGRSDAGAPAAPIPGAQKLPDTICASFAATGRGWRHPTFTCRRPAPGRRARWLEIQGPVPTGSGESASNGGGAEARLQWLKADAAVTGSDPSPQRWKRNPASARGFWPRPKRTAKEWHGSQDAAARVPKGSPLRRAKALHWLRSRRPRHPSHPRRHRRRGWKVLVQRTGAAGLTWPSGPL